MVVLAFVLITVVILVFLVGELFFSSGGGGGVGINCSCVIICGSLNDESKKIASV